MSFEMKYDRDGKVIKTQEPVFQEVAPAASIEEVEVEASAEETVDNSETVETEAIEQDQGILEAPQENMAKNKPTKTEPAESWKIIRERAEKAERRAQELEEALAAKQAQPQEDLDFAIDEDALAEGKHLNKVQKKLKAMEAKLKQYEQQTTMNDVRTQLKNQFSDWDKVFNDENLARLQEQEPELAYALNSASDPYKAGVSAYKLIKKMGIIAPEDTFIQDKEIVQKNAAKPKTMASLRPQQGDSPLSKANAFANGLTDDLKKQMWQEMNSARKGY